MCHVTLLAKRSANSCCYTPRNSASKMRKVGGDVSQWNSQNTCKYCHALLDVPPIHGDVKEIAHGPKATFTRTCDYVTYAIKKS